MLKSFAQLDKNMSRAGKALVFWIVGATVLAITLPASTSKADMVGAFIWVANLPAAWFLFQAQKQSGRDPWFFGLISLVPVFAALHFIVLYLLACTTDHGDEV